MLIGGLQKLTLIDYPGKIACAVFTVGCNFRCPFCHNPELVNLGNLEAKPPIGGFASKLISEKEFFDFLKSRVGKLDGVCVSGGEPTLQKDLPNFLSKIKKLKFSVKLDTNGSNPEILKKLIEGKLVDYVAMDIKSVISRQLSAVSKYEKSVGVEVDLEKIRKSAEVIKNSGLDYEFRTTVVPFLHTKEDILEIAKELSSCFAKASWDKPKRYFLQQFRPENILDKSFEKEKPYPIETLQEICEEIKQCFDYCVVRE